MRNRLIITIIAGLLTAACSGQYKGMPREEVLDYQTRATYGSLHAMATAYAEAINAAVKEDTLHPGMYADYGVALAMMGHKGTACRMFNAEMRACPESRGMVMRVKAHLLPDMMNDTVANLYDTANIQQLALWAYDSVKAMQQLPRIAAVIDSTDTAWLRMQTPIDSVDIPIRLTANQKRELLQQQQAEVEMRKQAIADSIAAAKQAKIDARKEAKVQREKDKKAKEKERKAKAKQKKKEQTLKEKAKKEQAAAKAKAKKEQAAERERQKKQKKEVGK